MSDFSRLATDYHFLHWRYSPGRRLLTGPDAEVRLKPLLDRLLRRLLDEPGKVLAREHLIEQVWTRRQVNDEVLSRAIAELRALLGDDAREPRFVETLSKGGYRWIAPVTQVVPQSTQESIQSDRPVASTRKIRRGRYTAVFGAALILCAVIAWFYAQHQDGDANDRAELALDLLGAQPLTADPRLEYDARFDSIGRVVYIRADQHTDASELVMVDPVSLAERVLWQDTRALRHPAVSPSGREIAVTRRTEPGCELWSVSLLDLHRTRLGDCAPTAGGGLEWIDGGDALLYTGAAADAAHAPGLILLDRRSGKHRALTTPDISEGAHVDPRLSGDGTLLAYASKHGDEGQLWQTDWPRLQHRNALLKRQEPIYGHAFEPDGNGLWVAGDLTRYRALHRLHRGGDPTLIGGRGALSIDLAANGAAVWSQANYDGDIHIGRSAGGIWTAIARSNRYESQPEFSADGKQLALVSNRNGTEAVFVFDQIDGSVRQLSLNAQFRWVRPTWSSRDQSLILTAYEDLHTRLYRYRLDGDVLELVAHTEQGAFHGTELADRLLYLSGHGTEQSALMQLREGQVHAEKLELGVVLAYRASESWLVWRVEGSPALQAAPFPALNPVREISRVDEGMTEAFALAGSVLYFIDQGKMWTLSLPDGQPTAVTTAYLPSDGGPSFAASASGELAVVSLASVSIDLMIARPPPAKP